MTRRRLRDGLGHAFLLGLAGLLACCRPQGALEVEYAGCKEFLEPGAICTLGSARELRLWVGAAPEARIELRVDGRRIDATGEPIRAGKRFSLTLPLGAKRLEVRVEATNARAAWFLAFAESAGEEIGSQVRQGALRDVLSEVKERMLGVHADILLRRLAAVQETLAGLSLPAKAPAEARCRVSYYRGLLAEREGNYRLALAEVHQAVEIAERVKLDAEQWRAEEEMALLLRGVGRSSEAAQLFERLRRPPHRRDSCEEARLLNNEGWSMLLAHEAGESLGDPTPLLEQALATYETCESATPEMRGNVLINLTLAQLQEGHLPQAEELLLQVHQLEPHPPLPHTLWWRDLEARIALRKGRPETALHLFDELAELAAETASFDSSLRAAFGQAQSHRALGDGAAALRVLRQTEALLDEQSLQIPVHEGRERFVAARQAIVSLHVELLLGQRRTVEALEAARHARSRVLRQLAHAEGLASLSLDQRSRRARLLADYEERRTGFEARASEDWKLPADQLGRERAARKAEAEAAQRLLDEAFQLLGDPGKGPGGEPPPRPGELLLVYHPLAAGWVGFAADGGTVVPSRFELPPDLLTRPAELARRLLLPFHVQIQRAERIRILTSGPLENVDFHALPFAGQVLLAGRPVVYGLDLPVAQYVPQSSGRQALLVTNPRGDLPGTVGEAEAVRKALESGPRPWLCEELKGNGASVPAVRARLATADLLHYAGHGSFSGLGGWESSLLLADDTQLTLGDLLALEAVPAWVVLSGCDTGRSSAEIPVAGLGLAHAFLLAGSRAVVASTRPADDRALPAFFAELYRLWAQEPDLAVALQRAQLSWHLHSPEADWASFRLLEP